MEHTLEIQNATEATDSNKCRMKTLARRFSRFAEELGKAAIQMDKAHDETIRQSSRLSNILDRKLKKRAI